MTNPTLGPPSGPPSGPPHGTSAESLIPVVYQDLRALAENLLRRERSGHTLQATALVHEAYLRLAGADRYYLDHNHLLAAAAHLLRQLLAQHARARSCRKRGGDRRRVELRPEELEQDEQDQQDQRILAVDEALVQLARLNPQRARLVELRFFGGLSVEECARVLDTSPRTVARRWNVARAWLTRALREDPRLAV